MSTSSHYDQLLEQSAAAIAALTSLREPFARAVDSLVETLRAGNKILICGNGGSAADSAHFATELLCRFREDRAPWAALSLTNDGSFLTATGNDYDFAQVFSRQIEGLGQKGDLLVAISTSGKSPNILEALKAAGEKGMQRISLLGKDGGEARGLAEIDLIVPHENTARIQECHQVLIHGLCEAIEEKLLG